jgi:hypothetical protein
MSRKQCQVPFPIVLFKTYGTEKRKGYLKLFLCFIFAASASNLSYPIIYVIKGHREAAIMMAVKVYGLEEKALREWAARSRVTEEAFIRQVLRALRTAGVVVLPERLKIARTGKGQAPLPPVH